MYRTILPIYLAFAITIEAQHTTADAATINVDTVLGSNHPYPNETIIVSDGDNPPTHLAVVDAAIIGGIPGQSSQDVGIDAFGSSVVNMLGGFVLGVKPVLLHDQAVLRMRGGEIHLVEATDTSRVVVDDGIWGGVRAYDSSRVRVHGGNENGIYGVSTFGQAHAAISPTDFLHLDFYAHDSSTMLITGGSFEGAEAMDNARVLLNGGSFVTGVRVKENAVLDVRYIRSIVGEWLDIRDSAVVNIYGTDLRLDVTQDDQPIVLGKWANGENLGVRYYLFDQGQIILHEVPEPTTGALLAIAAAAAGILPYRRAHRARR